MIQLLRVPIVMISLDIMLRSVSRQNTTKASFVHFRMSAVCSKTFLGSLRIIFLSVGLYTVSSSERFILLCSPKGTLLLAFPSLARGKAYYIMYGLD
jgi:hypothetical protein